VTVSLDPVGDKWEIRLLIEAYASAVDRADGEAAAELFADDGELDMWLDPTRAEPTARRRGHDEIREALRQLEQFDATQHVIGNVWVDVEVDGETASGETQCTAHHVKHGDANVTDTVLYMTYVDAFARVAGRWRFARRELRVRWTSLLPVESI
jgi:ketosteroid isomerase-like protein